jgi:hypothetical protein
VAILSDFVAVKDEISNRYLSLGAFGGFKGPPSEFLVAAAVERSQHPVHAVGVGHKLVDGKRVGELCIRFYVSQKLPNSMVPADARLPETIDGLPTDVIESPPAYAAASIPACSSGRKAWQRPMPAGISAAHFGVTAGTIGYFCTSTDPNDDPDVVYMLSNNHILAKMNAGRSGDAIYQPGPADGGVAADSVARLTRFKHVSFKPQGRNLVDAAIAELDDVSSYLPSICSIGKVMGTAKAVEELKVVKHGRTTGLSHGVVADVSVNQLVSGLDPSNPSALARFRNQIRIDPATPEDFAQPGDSGSLVVTEPGHKAIGLLFACPANGGYGLANPIDAVLGELKIQFV